MSLRSGEVIEPGLLASDDPQHGARESWRVEWQRLLPLTISTTFQNFMASFGSSRNRRRTRSMLRPIGKLPRSRAATIPTGDLTTRPKR